jgi:hypothetical protein
MFIISVGGRHCDYSPQAPKSWTTALHAQIPKSLFIHAYIPCSSLLNKLADSKKFILISCYNGEPKIINWFLAINHNLGGMWISVVGVILVSLNACSWDVKWQLVFKTSTSLEYIFLECKICWLHEIYVWLSIFMTVGKDMFPSHFT